MAELDMKLLERVVDGEACPVCYATIKDVHGHITVCSCMVLAQNDVKLQELMEWATVQIVALVPSPNLSIQKKRKAERKLRMVQSAVRQALQTLTSPLQEVELYHGTTTDIWGNPCKEVMTVRRDLHSAITELGATTKIVQR